MRRLTALTVLALAVLQAILLAPTRTAAGLAVGVLVVLASAVLLRADGVRRWLSVAAVSVIAIANLCVDAIRHPLPSPMPQLFATAIYGYASLVVSALLAVGVRRNRDTAVLTAVSAWVMLIGGHVVLAHRYPVALQTEGPAWTGGAVPHAVLGEWYPPLSVSRTLYPTNPRGYLTEAASDMLDWELMLHHEGSQARLVTAGKDVLRVEIDQARVPTDWHVQLTRSGLAVRRGEQYQVSVRVRADRAREISVGVSQGHPPWGDLGWYRTTPVGTTWDTFTDVFTATATDDRARVAFNVGASATPVELADVQILRVADKESAFPARPPMYYVEYRFNSRGCRGPEPETPAPTGQRRILAVGDSFTLGVGVHEQDTFAHQLGTLLNAEAAAQGGGRTYEVANCGVSGYATREARLMYELQAPHYRPDLVILTMVHNDDRSWRSDVEAGFVHRPSNLERSLLPWAVMQFARAEGRRPPADFTSSVQEIRQLDDEVRREGGRLVVVVFRSLVGDAPVWQPLLNALTSGLAGSDVPWIDLGATLPPDQRDEDLLVHPIDSHPNERAHRRAAESIAGFLRQRRLID